MDSKKVIYLDNAATTWPKLKEVKKIVNDYFETCCTSPGRTNGNDITTEIRQKLLDYFDANSDYSVALVPSATIGMNIVIKSIISENKSNHIITTNCEHHCVYRPLIGYDTSYDIVDYLNNKQEEQPNKIFEKINKNTKAVIMNHGSNVTGDIFNVKKIGENLRGKNIIFVVDISQTAGFEDISIKNLNADILIGSAHKHLYGLSGIGYIIYRKSIKLKPIYYGGTGKLSSSIKQPEVLPDMLESGTANIVGLLSLKKSLEVMNQKKRKQIREYENNLVNYFINNCKEIKGVKTFSGKEGKRTGVISVCIKNLDPTYVVAPYLSSQGNVLVRAGLHCAPLIHKAINTFPEGTVRLSVSHNTTKEELDIVIKLLKELCEE